MVEGPLTGLDPDFDEGEFEDESWSDPGVLSVLGAVAVICAVMIFGAFFAAVN